MNSHPSSSAPIREHSPSQDLNLDLVRHYADVLRMLTDRLAPVASPPVLEESAPPPEPVVAVPDPDQSTRWESEVSRLDDRDWHRETLVHLWLHPQYVLGVYVLVGIGVNLRGHRRIVTLTECGPEDQSAMEAVLDGLTTRGLGRRMLLTIPGNVALRAAVSCVWGPQVWVQQCLNTVMAEALSGLDPERSLEFRHRLQQAWQHCDANRAQTELRTVTEALTHVNRSSGRVLERALDSTLTLQRTGLLLRSDRGLRVLNSIQTLVTRARKLPSTEAIPQPRMRLCAALLELEPRLRRVQHSAYLSQLHSTLKSNPPIPS